MVQGHRSEWPRIPDRDQPRATRVRWPASNHDALREKVIEDLTRSDGLRLKPYRDSAGKLTIGVGRNLDDNGISEAEARLLLARDVDDAWRDLDDNCPWWGRMPERHGQLC